MGSPYVRGAFSGTLTIGDTTLTATYGLDMFIAKYDADLTPVWMRQGSGLGSAPSPEMAIEGLTVISVSDADVYDAIYLYVAGFFVKTLTRRTARTRPSRPPTTSAEQDIITKHSWLNTI